MSEMKVKICVVGSAGGPMDEGISAQARLLGRTVAERGCVLITGACPGYPQQAVLGAKERGGFVVGISPALSWKEHVERYHAPWREYDALVYAGSGLMGREVHIIRTGDVVLVVAGRSGTLGEFAIAYDEGKLIGVLEGTGGVADHVPALLQVLNKDTGADLLFDAEPVALVDRALEMHEQQVAAGKAYVIPDRE